MEGVGIFLFIVLIRCALGAAAAAIAGSKGRSKVGWFFGGLLLDVIAIIIVAVLPNLKEQHAYRLRVESEARRLREQVKQEQIKAESYRQYAMNRLDLHDNALGLDTRTALPSGEGAGTPLLEQGAAASWQPQGNFDVWYYELNGTSVGPVTEGDIRMLLQQRMLAANTLVWREGFAEWTPANQTGTFVDVLGM